MNTAIQTALAALHDAIATSFPESPTAPETSLDYWSANQGGQMAWISVTFKDGGVHTAGQPLQPNAAVIAANALKSTASAQAPATTAPATTAPAATTPPTGTVNAGKTS